LPVVAVLSLIFIRTRRLPPLIVAHWTADALAVLATALLPALRHWTFAYSGVRSHKSDGTHLEEWNLGWPRRYGL